MQVLSACPCCRRTFVTSRVHKHLAMCRRLRPLMERAGVFESAKQRAFFAGGSKGQVIGRAQDPRQHSERPPNNWRARSAGWREAVALWRSPHSCRRNFVGSHAQVDAWALPRRHDGSRVGQRETSSRQALQLSHRRGPNWRARPEDDAGPRATSSVTAPAAGSMRRTATRASEYSPLSPQRCQSGLVISQPANGTTVVPASTSPRSSPRLPQPSPPSRARCGVAGAKQVTSESFAPMTNLMVQPAAAHRKSRWLRAMTEVLPGRPTSSRASCKEVALKGQYVVGDICETVAAVTLRKEESIHSSPVAHASPGRLQVRSRSHEGWISTNDRWGKPAITAKQILQTECFSEANKMNDLTCIFGCDSKVAVPPDMAWSGTMMYGWAY